MKTPNTMFKSITKPKGNLSVSAATKDENGISCLIAKGTTIEGKFNSVDDVRVDGIINGDVFCQKRLLVGATGWIDGTIHTHDATIGGYVKGNLIVAGILRLESTANIEGNIVAKELEVVEGAQYNGACKVGDRFVKGAEQEMAMVA